MRVELFDFDLPRELIAQHPVRPRDAARLLVIGDALQDRHVRDLPDILRPGDLLVVNDTRVLPARLIGRRGSSRIEITLYRPLDERTWEAFAKPARRCRPGDVLCFAPGFETEVVGRAEGGVVILRFDLGPAELRAALERHGHMPLPPYIARSDEGDPADHEDYQTCFAEREGAVAAPTAGLHFTDELMARLAARGIDHVALTLHVGAGTFLPVKSEDTEGHRMHAEAFELSEPTAARINEVRARGGRVVAVGTTVLRTLETVADEQGRARAASGTTALFIVPGFRFKAVDLLLTNFHLPRSTLFMLVCAFGGLERMRSAYEHAKRRRYRFYSYGDACLIERGAEQKGV